MRGVPTYADHVHEILAIDGRHTTNRKWNKLSDDGSREYLQKFDNVRLVDCSDYEVTKRKLAKEICTTEHLLIIDSDEYVEGNWPKFYNHYELLLERDVRHLDLFALRLQRFDHPIYFDSHPVLFHNPSQFTYYRDKHNIPIKKIHASREGIFAPEFFLPVVEGIYLCHNHKLRSPERMAVREDNLNWQFSTQS